MRPLDSEQLVSVGGGPLCAVLLGLALSPLREATTASNFTFAFLALTILVAEFGGRGAALATAVASALSLDFFLTRPYGRLSIESKHDLIAFAGLSACGLLAGAFGARRAERQAELLAALRREELLVKAAHALEGPAFAESGVLGLVRAARAALPLAAIVLRDARGAVIAASGDAPAVPPPPAIPHADPPRPPGASDLDRPDLLPGGGCRIGLVAFGAQVGWLDVWGGRPRGHPASRPALGALARLLAVALSSVARSSRVP